MYDIRKISREKYVDLRKTVREHVTVNAGILSCNREKFYSSKGDKKFIAGGVVLAKETIKRCYYRRAVNCWNYLTLEELIKIPDRLDFVEFVSTRFKFKLYDFSGVFYVTFDSGGDYDPIDLARVREGDIIYAIARRIFPYSMDTAFEVIGESLLSLEEVVRLKAGDLKYSTDEVERDFFKKKEIEDIRNSPVKEDICYEAEFGEDPMTMIRFFLKKGPDFGNTDYLWLFGILQRAYRKRPTEKMANMVGKYYKLWHNSQNWEGLDEKTKKEDFYWWFPKMEGLVPETFFNSDENGPNIW